MRSIFRRLLMHSCSSSFMMWSSHSFSASSSFNVKWMRCISWVKTSRVSDDVVIFLIKMFLLSFTKTFIRLVSSPHASFFRSRALTICNRKRLNTCVSFLTTLKSSQISLNSTKSCSSWSCWECFSTVFSVSFQPSFRRMLKIMINSFRRLLQRRIRRRNLNF